MDGLQRSAVSFRRQGSSGLVWDDKFLSGEFKKKEEHDRQIQQQLQLQSQDNNKQLDVADADVDKDVLKPISIERSRSNGGGTRHHRGAGKISPNIEPPSPKVSACGFCSAFGKPSKKQRRGRPGKRRSK
jgi:hypothetical protein